MTLQPQRHSRSRIEVDSEKTVKYFSEQAAAEHEISFYLEVPWACPKLFDYDATSIVIETLPVAIDIPYWKPKRLFLELLQRLHLHDIHHRDAHVKNILKRTDGYPVLIDWEFAIRQKSIYSYDIFGPARSGIPIPDGHKFIVPACNAAQWWGSPEPHSISRRWR